MLSRAKNFITHRQLQSSKSLIPKHFDRHNKVIGLLFTVTIFFHHPKLGVQRLQLGWNCIPAPTQKRHCNTGDKKRLNASIHGCTVSMVSNIFLKQPLTANR